MSLLAKYLPQATPIDPAEDPPGSIDPLGTLSPAERIAEVLFPAFTARMWHPRFLTFAALAALVSERITAKGNGSEKSGLSVRLGFERLFVSAVVRQHVRDFEGWDKATRRLPGSSLARKALLSEDTPLGRNNFLKGQAVNGPFGVIARLARHLDIVDENDRLGRNGEKLLLAWAADESLLGLLDEDNSGSPGRQWIDRFVKETAAHLTDFQWKKPGWSGWQELAERLRPDKVRRQESREIRSMLNSDAICSRCLELLSESKVVALYCTIKDNGWRGEQDRTVLNEGLLPLLLVNERQEDRAIKLAIQLADAYEQVASILETAFNSLRWGLTHRGGQAISVDIENDRTLQSVFRLIHHQLPACAHRLRKHIQEIPTVPRVGDLNPIEPLDTLASQALVASESPKHLIKVIIERHRDVQRAKGKGMWIESGERLTLMPGFGYTDETPQSDVKYLHTFRVPNAYSFLGELGLKGLEAPDGEA
jgi:hypothetical protein